MNGEKGMDWMYKGPSALVNREEYLTGRTVDKALKLLDATEKGDKNFSYLDEVEKDLTPLSIFSARSQGPVDVIRKIKEDPLFQIQKQEEERLRELLDNPVRLKKLQEMAKKQQSGAAASSSKAPEKFPKSKQKRSSSSSSDSSEDDGEDIDKLLAQKLKQLKDPKDLLNLSKSSSSREEPRHSASSRYRSDRDRRRSRSRSPRDSRHTRNERSMDYRRSRGRSGDRDRRHRNEDRDRDSSQKQRPYARNDRESDKRYGASSSSSSSRSSRPEPPPKRKAIDEEERERKLREMMDNCKWRDEQRVKNVSKHRDEVQKEEEIQKSKHDTEFIRKQLNVAAATGSVEKRIKANSYNIQRSKGAMDQNFARR